MIACQHAHEALRPPTAKTFTFTSTPLPLSAPLTFSADLPALDLSCARKRARPVEDVDGTAFAPRKKRRIRFQLITSRLSQPYAVPTTHIIDRGSSKIAVFAKQRALGRNHIRKAAIMNRVRRNRARGDMPSPPPALKPDPPAQAAGEENEMRAPRKQFVPPPPSPLGLSNYDALDNDYSMDGDDETADDGYYSDFNVMYEDELDEGVDEEEADSIEPLDLGTTMTTIPEATGKENKSPSLPDEKLIEMLKEQERQKEVSFVKFG